MYCWGSAREDFRLLEDPKLIRKFSAISILSVGAETACVLDDSTPTCWTRWLPQRAPVPLRVGSGTLTDLSAWGGVCGVDSAGRGRCWRGDKAVPTDSGEIVLPGVALTAIRSGGGNQCAITKQNRLRCWGYGQYGLLGSIGPSRLPFAQSMTPAGIPEQVVDVSLGKHHACALSADGIPWCWGANTFGELGVDTTQSADKCPTFISIESVGPRALRCSLQAVPVSLAGAKGISVGESHSCAVTSDSSAYCWGSNLSGQLGIGTVDSLAHARPEKLIGGYHWRAITAGRSHTCGVTTDNDLLCWGDNNNRQLGGRGGARARPGLVRLPGTS